MANIVINEISQNYTYNIGASSYATVALPITACWGPAYAEANPVAAEVESYKWTKFPATQEGLEAFVSTFRGPASNYRLTKDFSYQMAMTLITSGYDVLVTRVCPGGQAQADGIVSAADTSNKLVIKAKYAGTFGNNLRIRLQRLAFPGQANKFYWNMIIFVVDNAGGQTAVENKIFVLDAANSTDTIPYYEDMDSAFVTFTLVGALTDDVATAPLVAVSTSALTAGGSEAPTVDGKTVDIATIANGDVYDYQTGTPVTSSYFMWTTAANDTDVKTSSTAVTVGGTEQPTIDGTATTPTAGMKVKYTNSSTGTTIYVIWSNNAWAAYVGCWSAFTGYVTKNVVDLTGGADAQAAGTYSDMMNSALGYAKQRYGDANTGSYLSALTAQVSAATQDLTYAANVRFNEWVYTAAWAAYGALTDKLSYNPNRVISPGWDDQDINAIMKGADTVYKVDQVSPLHAKLMDTAFYSRCATAYIDIPRSCTISEVYNESADTPGYAQMLSRYQSATAVISTNGPLYQTNSALFAPWGQFIYTGTSKQNTASPSFMALMIQRAQILNQPAQYEWALPTNRKHNLKLGKLDYTVSKKYLDQWQTLEGVGVNAITTIPDLGTNIWGNSTLYEVPPATYQALANLSTRLLVNAVEDVAYRCGVSITYQYNNAQAYDKFYAGVTPLLDTMKNVGAIEDYYVTMAADIDGLDSVNANTVIGKIYLTVNGVINDIYIDLIALPPSVDLDQFRS